MAHVVTVAALVAALLALLVVRRVPRGAHIVDGDTIRINDRKWRLAGYDSPERDQPGGKEATERLRSIIQAETVIGLVYGIDCYRRLLVRCYTLRGPLSWRMIGSGHAHATGWFGAIPMIWARILRRGLWSGSNPVVAPRNWRASHPKAMPAPTIKLFGRRKRRKSSAFKDIGRTHARMVRKSKKWLV